MAKKDGAVQGGVTRALALRDHMVNGHFPVRCGAVVEAPADVLRAYLEDGSLDGAASAIEHAIGNGAAVVTYAPQDDKA